MAILHGLTYQQYADLPGWNWGLISEMEKSPAHVHYKRHHRDEGSTASRDLLRAIHCLVLEGAEVFEEQFSVFDGMVRRGKAWTEHQEANPGKTHLKAMERDQVVATAWAIREHPACRDLLAVGHGEVSITWKDEATGLDCKGRIDWLNPGAILDLKTIGTTDEREVAKRVAANRWHGQLAHYTEGLKANGLPSLPAFIVAAEGKGPQDVAVFEVDPGAPDGALYVGLQLRKRLMQRIAECVELGHWPGRHATAQALCLPPYALIDAGEEFEWSEETADVPEEVF